MHSDENIAMTVSGKPQTYDYALIDTCSLMEDSFPLWMDRLATSKAKHKGRSAKIFVPKECVEELKGHTKSVEDFMKRSGALRALQILKGAKRMRLLGILKTQKKDHNAKSFADHAIMMKLTADRLDKKVLVITQDKKLASDIIGLNGLLSQRGRFIDVAKIDVNGELVSNKGELLLESNEQTKARFSNAKKVERAPQTVSKPAAPSATKPETKPAEAKTPNVEKPKPVEAPKKEVKPVVAAPVKTIVEKAPEEKPTTASPVYSGTGKDLKAAFFSCAHSGGFLFRYPTIPYLAQFHGPADLIEGEEDKILESLQKNLGAPKEFLFKDFYWKGERLNVDSFRVTAQKKAELTQKTAESAQKADVEPKAEPKEKPTKATKEKAEKAASPAADIDYEKGKAAIIENHPFLTISKAGKVFSCGYYRASKLVKRLQDEGVLSTEATNSDGFKVLLYKGKKEEVPTKPVVNAKEAPKKFESSKPAQNKKEELRASPKADKPKTTAKKKTSLKVEEKKPVESSSPAAEPLKKAKPQKKSAPAPSKAESRSEPKQAAPKTEPKKKETKRATSPAASNASSENGRLIVFEPGKETKKPLEKKKKSAEEPKTSTPKKTNASLKKKTGGPKQKPSSTPKQNKPAK